MSLPELLQGDAATVSLSWASAAVGGGSASSMKEDLDLQCCAFDGVGLVIDACFYNNPVAAEGGLVLESGDCTEGSERPEVIRIDTAKLPPFCSAVVCGIYNPSGRALSRQMINVAVHCPAANERNGLGAGIPLTSAAITDVGSNPGVIIFVFQRTLAGSYTVSLFERPTKGSNFANAIPDMQSLLNVDPVLREELKKNQPVFQLKKGAGRAIPCGLRMVGFGLGWDAGCDVDASVLGYARDGTHKGTVWFCAKNGFDGAITHGGDNLSGAGEGDDEVIQMNLQRIPLEVTHLYLCVCVYTSGKDFTDVRGEFCRLFNLDPSSLDYKREYLRMSSMDAGSSNSKIFAVLYRDSTIPERWMVSLLDQNAKGRTANELTDPVRNLHLEHYSTQFANCKGTSQGSGGGCCVIS
jgi:tellurium resistance protein TerZ